MEVEGTKKEIEYKWILDERMEYFEEWKLHSEYEDGNDLLCWMFDGWVTCKIALCTRKKAN